MNDAGQSYGNTKNCNTDTHKKKKKKKKNTVKSQKKFYVYLTEMYMAFACLLK